MKKIALLFLAIMAMTACGSKTNSTQQVADSTVVKELPDTLNNAEAVTRQVDAVYSYWNELREHFDESQPTVDERFGTQEWRRVRQDVDAIDRECECGGFFDFGEDGPLDAWTYDCYEGTVSANNIQVKMQPDGTAEVRFLIKDASTPKGRPVRWLMRVENGEWRVANIFFENDDDYDLLMNMRAYADDGKYNKSFNINKYLPDMKQQLAEKQDVDPDGIFFDAYGLVDIDLDGTPEVYVQNKERFSNAVFSVAGGKVSLLAASFGATEIYFYEHGVGAQGGCGTGCMMSDCTVIKDSRPVVSFRIIDEYDMEGNLVESNTTKEGQKITNEEYERLFAQLGKQVNLSAMMHDIDE